MTMKALQLVALAAIVAIVTACSSTAEEPASKPQAATSTTTTTETTTAPTPEDSYIDDLDKTGLFPANVTGDARDVWIRTGREACNLLKVNGNVVSTRFTVAQSIADYSKEGMAEDGLVDRAVVLVAAAQLHLCPDVLAS